MGGEIRFFNNFVKNTIKGTGFLVIPKVLLVDENLKQADCFVYAIIYDLVKMKEQRCFASNQYIAGMVGLTAGTVANALTRLEKYGFIQRKFEDDNKKKQRQEIIPLMDFSIHPQMKGIHPEMNDHSPTDESSIHPQMNIINTIDNKYELTNTKDLQPEVAEHDSINRLFDILYRVNPTLNYGNKSQRAAAQTLIGKFGLEKTIKLAEAAVFCAGQKFAPVITTPYQLKEKLAQLINYIKKEQSNQIVVIS